MFTPQALASLPGEPALDARQLYLIGLRHLQEISCRVWNDHNLHDPGITTLEYLSYALTELGYRASFPIPDLLASEKDNRTNMEGQFFSARRILTNRPLTPLDYRKLLIDLPGVRNAWLHNTSLTYYLDKHLEAFLPPVATGPEIKEVEIGGLYDVVIEYEDDVNEEKVRSSVKERLRQNRNLCEDFADFRRVEEQWFNLCCEIELAPDADLIQVAAEIRLRVEQYLSPPVRMYSLEERLAQGKSADQIFDGPALDGGFIDDEELAQSELRKEIRLSDIICRIMDIEGVRAVRDIVVNATTGCPSCKPMPPANKWLLPVEAGKKPALCFENSRLVFYKRNMPFELDIAHVNECYDRLLAQHKQSHKPAAEPDFDIPLGKYRHADRYYSFQNHFPAIYGLSQVGMDGATTEERKTQIHQFKGYLLFFDQMMANYLAQLAHVKNLFSTNPQLHRTYYYQAVDSFTSHDKLYGFTPAKVKRKVRDLIQDKIEDKKILIERRNRFLDHLVARFGERFHDMAHLFGNTPEKMAELKCRFLRAYPAISCNRARAYDYSLQEQKDLWNSSNVSGLEKRLAKLLGLSASTRRNLGWEAGQEADEGGMYLIENILLRPQKTDDPYLPVCLPVEQGSCADVDPYSWRIHIILPAEAKKFEDMNFRRFTEEVIREETPAHILPKICWISNQDMLEFQELYRDWISLKADVANQDSAKERQQVICDFTRKLFKLKSVYPPSHLSGCDSGESQDKFILGQTGLGTRK